MTMIQVTEKMQEYFVIYMRVIQTVNPDIIVILEELHIKHLKNSKNLALTHTNWGPEIEFFVFDTINVYPSPYAATHSYGGSGYSIESKESPWAKGNVSTAIDIKEGYYPSQPKDTLEGFRKDVCDDLYNYFGIKIEAEHHEVATSGQCEINLVYDEMISMADDVIAVKNLVKVKAKRKNKVATFMPKTNFW